MKRILLDRSIFHKEKFERIQKSNLQNAVKSGSIRLYYTPGFIEETLRNIKNDIKTFTLQWNYLFELNHEYWFKSPIEIIQAEYNGDTNGEYYLRVKEEIIKQKNYVDKLISGEIPITTLDRSVNETKFERQRKGILRDKILDERNNKIWSIEDFEDFIVVNAIHHFRDILLPITGITTAFVQLWKDNPDKFPFTDFYLRSILSTIFVPVVDHQLAVHINDKSDAQQLVYLLWTDVIVTDDTRFMLKAFNILNRGNKKELWTLDHFLSCLSSLSIVENTSNN